MTQNEIFVLIDPHTREPRTYYHQSDAEKAGISLNISASDRPAYLLWKCDMRVNGMTPDFIGTLRRGSFGSDELYWEYSNGLTSNNIDYCILTDDNSCDLEIKVKEHVNRGWIPTGGIIRENNKLAQAMIRKSSNKPQE